MTTKRVASVAVCTSAILATIAACASEQPGSGPPASSSESISAQTSVFDACADIDDATIRAAGLNPTTRQPVTPGPGQTSACSFQSDDLTVVVASTRQTFEDYRDANAGIREGLDIHERPTVIVRRPEPNAPCELGMKAANGLVLVTSTITITAREWGMDSCGQIVNVATAIEPAIGSH